MKRETYIRMMDYWRKNPVQLRTLVLSNKAITASIYVAYPCLLLFLAFTAPFATTVRATIVPFLGLIGVSALRRIVNAPRPYQAFQTESALHKDTQGESFPSKHTFCIFVIGMAFLASLPNPTPGIIVLALGVILAGIRVVCGVHFTRDVLAGAFLGITLGFVGFYCI